MLAEHDAALLIGDPALFVDHRSVGEDVEKIDLGQAWTEMTGLPFVWAFWAGRAEALPAERTARLQETKRVGLGISDELADSYVSATPQYRALARQYLRENIRYDLNDRMLQGLRTYYREAASLGLREPWLWRLTFGTRGLVRDDQGELKPVERHVVAVRFLPDYLRRVNQFQTLSLVEPHNAFHPNLAPPAVCLHLYPGMPLVEIAESLHNLFRWQLRQLAENDALNVDACAWGRSHLGELPLDTRPLFGRAVTFQLEEIA